MQQIDISIIIHQPFKNINCLGQCKIFVIIALWFQTNVVYTCTVKLNNIFVWSKNVGNAVSKLLLI